MSEFLQRLLRQRGDNLKPLERLAQKAGNELYAHGLQQGRALPGLISKAVKTVRLPKRAEGYVFWLLVEQPRFWPPMPPKQREALQWALDLMEKSNATPPLDGDFILPHEDAESDVEDVVMATARWAESSLRASMMLKYKQVLDANKGEAAKIMGSSPEQARNELAAALLVSIKRKPRWFKDADFLHWALSSLIP